MRFAARLILAVCAAPGIAQQAFDPTRLAAQKQTPPPEGFYRGIPNAYDLAARPLFEPAPLPIETCLPKTMAGMTAEEREAAIAAFRSCVEEHRKSQRRGPLPYSRPRW